MEQRVLAGSGDTFLYSFIDKSMSIVKCFTLRQRGRLATSTSCTEPIDAGAGG